MFEIDQILTGKRSSSIFFVRKANINYTRYGTKIFEYESDEKYIQRFYRFMLIKSNAHDL